MKYEKYKQTGIPWLPEVPDEWESVPFKRVAEVKANLVHPELYPDYPQISPEQIEKGSGRLLPWKTVSEANVESDNHLFFCGQILYSKIRPLLNKVTIAPFDGLCSADMYPIETKENTRFLMYYMLSQAFGNGVANAVADRVKMPKINKGELGNIAIVVPPFDVQHAIVAYLDDKCGKIDELVAAKEKEVELLKELKQTVIADAVTKGVSNAPLRDSGIPWLPQIPEGWEEKRAKYLFRREQRPVVPGDDIVTCFRDGEVTLRKNRRTSGFTEATDYSHYQHICKGDLVIHQMDAFAGSTGVSDSDGMGTPVLSVCTPRCEDVDVYYYARLIRLMGINGFIQSLYRGIRERSSDFRFETFAKLLLPVPPLDEQRAIVAYIEEKTAKIDQAVAGLTQQVAALKEYKQRLIADVVTGQRKVV